MPATRSLHLFPREIDHRSAGLVGLRLLVVVAMVAASLFVVPLPAGRLRRTAAVRRLGVQLHDRSLLQGR